MSMNVEDLAKNLAAELNDLKEQLGAASDATGGLKVQARDQLAQQPTPADASAILSRLQDFNEEDVVAFWAKLQAEFEKTSWAKAYDKAVSEKVAALKESKPKSDVPTEKLKELREQYNAKVKHWNALQEVAVAFGSPDALNGLGTFRSIRGAIGGGTRGKRLGAPYIWTIDGNEKEYRTLTELAKGVGGGVKGGDIKKLIMTEYDLSE